MAKIKYTCKNCGWDTSIREEWADLKPKRCMNKKCNTSFLAKPDMLVIERPEKQQDEVQKQKGPAKIKRQEVSKSDE
jgi:hypothetical protein